MVGVFIAVPSGVGVALAVLGGNQAGGVGVAISASLLPPAVNTGLLFAMSLISSLIETNLEDQTTSDMVGWLELWSVGIIQRNISSLSLSIQRATFP